LYDNARQHFVRRLGVCAMYAVVVATAAAALPIPSAAASLGGGRIVYMRDDQLFVLDTRNGEPREITGQSPPRLSSAAWSPDGRRIAYLALPRFDDLSPMYRFEVRVVDANGSHDRMLLGLDGCCATPFIAVAGVWATPPVWSPDGGKLAFVSTTIACPTWGVCGAESTLYAVRSDGTHLTPVAVDHGGFDEPSWSPDGKRLAYSSADGIHVVTADGAGVPRRISPIAVIARSPVWAPDGKHIAFLGVPATEVSRYNADVWVASSEGAQERMLPVTSWGAPSWSPDSRTLAFGDDGIKTIRTDGSKLTRLTPSPPPEWNDHTPRWSPDGTRVAYAKDGPWGDACTLWMVRVDGTSRPRRLAWGTGPLAQYSWAPIPGARRR
jgi:Tol biopolymer transport system component